MHNVLFLNKNKKFCAFLSFGLIYYFTFKCQCDINLLKRYEVCGFMNSLIKEKYMEPKFKIGDVVELNSGGPQMTVTVAENIHAVTGKKLPFKGIITTAWFKDNNKYESKFPQDALNLKKVN